MVMHLMPIYLKPKVLVAAVLVVMDQIRLKLQMVNSLLVVAVVDLVLLLIVVALVVLELLLLDMKLEQNKL